MFDGARDATRGELHGEREPESESAALFGLARDDEGMAARQPVARERERRLIRRCERGTRI